MSDQDPVSSNQRPGKPDLPGSRFAFIRMVGEALDQQVAMGEPVAVQRTRRTLERLEKTPENERTPHVRRQIAWCEALLDTPFDGPTQG